MTSSGRCASTGTLMRRPTTIHLVTIRRRRWNWRCGPRLSAGCCRLRLRVLDAGAGTGFLSLLLAREGYRVTALDLAPAMLAGLRAKAQRRDLSIETVEGSAVEPPGDGYDAVVERHLVWTLPDPTAALQAWRKVAPNGTLVLLESAWGARRRSEQLRARARDLLRRLRNEPPDHHAEYAPDLRAELPFGTGTTPEQLVRLVESTAWGAARVERLRTWSGPAGRP